VNVKVSIQESVRFKRKLSEIAALSSIVLNQAGRDVADWLRRYHTRFRQKWQGPRYMAGPRSNLFWQQVVAGWQDPVVSGKKVTITNTFGLLKWKTTGGTITPKRARMLTIPLVPDAKGLSAAEYEAEEGTPLFRAGNALCRRIGKRLEAIYALKDSVHQEPWPGAMPPDDEIKKVFTDSVKLQIRNIARQK
jgi:hypothetical protein